MTSNIDIDAYIRQKWKALFKFANISGSGRLTISEVMEYPCRLLREGKVEEGCKLARMFEKFWSGMLEAACRPKGETSVTLEDWLKGQGGMSQQDWYQNTAMPAMSSLMFDIMDEDHDNVISLAEWRDHYKRYGINNEEFVRSTFAKMDTNKDGLISRQEFDYAIKMYNKHDPENDYSFLYLVD